MSLIGLVRNRISADWKLLSSIFLGILVATSLASGIPIYLSALEQQGFITSIDAVSSPVLTINVYAPNTLVTPETLQDTDTIIENAIDRYLKEIYLSHETYIKGGSWLVGFPSRPLSKGGGKGLIASRGYLQFLSNIESNSRFVSGRMASDEISSADYGPAIEAIISTYTANVFDARVGDVFTITSSLAHPTEVLITIVGIIEQDNQDNEYWDDTAILLNPPPLPTDTPLMVQVDPVEPPLALFVPETVLAQLLGNLVSARIVGDEVYITSSIFLAGVPGRPLPKGGGQGVLSSLGHLMNISNLEQHSRVIKGHMASDLVSQGTDGPMIEVVIAGATKTRVPISIGDILTLIPTLGSDTTVSAKVVGFIEQDIPSDPYWTEATIFLLPSTGGTRDTPSPATSGGAESQEVEESSSEATASRGGPLLVQRDPFEAPISLLVTRQAMSKVISSAYPGAVSEAFWSIQLDKENLKDWTVSETRDLLKGFEDNLLQSIPGSLVNTGFVRGVTTEGQTKSVVSKVPLLLIMSVMTATSLYLLIMMVYYLTQSRDADTARLRTRGLSTIQFARIHTVEGIAITIMGVALSPLIAIGAVAVAGMLPFFSEITGGNPLPVRSDITPFLVAFFTGISCLAILVFPSFTSGRGGQLIHGLRSSRPPTMPWLHRHNIDFAVLIMGGLVFWEFEQRGHIVSGGLFTEANVNEALLLAPVLFLLAVALVFIRLFPLIMKFVSGESKSLVTLAVAVLVVVLSLGTAATGIREAVGYNWLILEFILMSFATTYWATGRLQRLSSQLSFILIQAILVSMFVSLEGLDPAQILFAPTVGLIAIVPLQIAFPMIQAGIKSAPAWLSIGLWYMARTPMQYAWLILLLVLVTGLGILSNTVGATLKRSETDQVLYELPSDIVVSGLGTLSRNPDALREDYESIAGVNIASPTLRDTASIATASAEIVAVESEKFLGLAWYREDFSSSLAEDVLAKLKPAEGVQTLDIPDDSVSLGLWLNPIDISPFMSFFVVIGYGDGSLHTLSLEGALDRPGWNFMRADIPNDLDPPLHLVSFQIFEPTFAQGTPGRVLIDGIHITSPRVAGGIPLEGFEEGQSWTPIETLGQQTHSITTVSSNSYEGQRSGSFSFGNQTDRGLRGIYYNPEGPLPVILSSSLSSETNHLPGDELVARIGNRWVLVNVVDTLDYFPTANPLGGGFIISDLDTLLKHTNVLFETYSKRPNGALIESDNLENSDVLTAMSEFVGRDVTVRDAASKLKAIRLDPFVSAGWKPMQILSPIIGTVAATVGYVTYLLLFTKRRWGEMGYLHVIGLSRLQMRALLFFQHLSIAVIGTGIGTWAGSLMSRSLVTPLSVTSTGQSIVPPFIITTDWVIMAINYFSLAILFIAILYIVNRRITRMELHTFREFGD